MPPHQRGSGRISALFFSPPGKRTVVGVSSLSFSTSPSLSLHCVYAQGIVAYQPLWSRAGLCHEVSPQEQNL